MLKPQDLLNTIHEQVTQILPDVGKSAQEDLSAQLKILVAGVISKLDLVSREEFDTQQEVLQRTRSKLEQLEKDFEALELKLNLTDAG